MKVGDTEYGVMWMYVDDEQERFLWSTEWTKDEALNAGVAVQMMPLVVHVQLVERKWVKSK